jgi:putative MATE family efflux protein
MFALKTDRLRRILTLALPIIGGMVSQNILNLVDTAMVGHLGDTALAAVGLGGFLTFMAGAFVTGLGTGVQAMSSRRLGEGRGDETAIPLNGGLVLAASIAVPLSIVLFFAVPDLFPLLVEDAEVVADGVPYLQIRMISILGLGANFAFRGYWNGVNLSRLYMRTLVIMHVTNAVLNYVLIFGAFGFPELGVKGAAVGSVVSVYVGTAYYVWLGFRHAREGGFASALPDRDVLVTMWRVSIPACLQNFFFAAGMSAFFWVFGQIGTAELAASQVIVNLMLVGLLPGLGLGLAAASLVGQALGRTDVDDAERWGWEVAQVTAGLVLLLSIPVLVVPEFFLSGFIHEPDTLALAVGPMRLLAGVLWLDLVGIVLMNALFGAGDSRRVMIIGTGLQWAFGLPLAYVLGVSLGFGIMGAWGGHVVYRLVQTGVMVAVWKSRKWAHIKV